MTSPENALSLETVELETAETELPSEAESEETPESDRPGSSPGNRSMGEFYALRRELLLSTLVISIVCFAAVVWYYGANTAASYALGSAVGMLYLRLLAKGVERMEPGKSAGKNRLALLVVVIVLAARWNQLEVLPVFLGFLTYKAALIYYTLRITLIS